MLWQWGCSTSDLSSKDCIQLFDFIVRGDDSLQSLNVGPCDFWLFSRKVRFPEKSSWRRCQSLCVQNDYKYVPVFLQKCYCMAGIQIIVLALYAARAAKAIFHPKPTVSLNVAHIPMYLLNDTGVSSSHKGFMLLMDVSQSYKCGEMQIFLCLVGGFLI